MDRGKAYYDEQGNLLVWTGTGYHKVPTIAAGDVGENVVNSYYDENSSTGYGLTPTSSYTDGYAILDPAKYGLPTDSNNFAGGGTSLDELNYLLKSGGLEGTQIKFVRQEDGSYKPTFEGLEAWDTNAKNRQRNIGLGMVAAGPLLAHLGNMISPGANSMTGAGGTALAGSADAALWGGLNAATGAVGAGTVGAGAEAIGAADGLANAGWGAEYAAASGLGPGGMAGGAWSTPGLITGATAAGLPLTAGPLTPQQIAAIEAAAAPNATPTPTSPTSIPDWMKNLSPNLVKGLLPLAGGLLGKPDEGGGSGTQAPIAPTTIPKLYGGGGTSGPGLMNSWGAMGPTETERRMRQQYLPGLLGGANPWGY